MQRMARTAAWVGIALGAVYLIYAGGGWWGIYSPVLRIITMTTAAVVLLSWAYAAWRHPSWRPQSLMLPAILALLASMAVSTAFSVVPRVSLEYLGYAVVLAAMYLLLVQLFAHDFFGRRFVALAAMLFVVSVIGYGAQVLLGWIHWWSLIGRVDIPPLRPDYGGLTYNNPSAALTMIALLAAPVVAAFGSPSRGGIARVIAVLAAVGVVALVSGSRSGWLALGTTAVVGSLVWIASSERRGWLRHSLGPFFEGRAARWLAIGLGATLVGLVTLLAPSVLRRIFEGGEDLRLSLYVAAVRIFTTSPLLGTGPGSWVILRPAYTQPGEIDFYIPHAHDIYVQTLAELGLLGALAGIVVLLTLVRLLRRAMSIGDGRTQWWVWAGGLALLYFGLHQVLDSYANMPAFMLAAALPIAYLDSVIVRQSDQPAPASPESAIRWLRPPRPLTLAGAALVCIAMVGLLLQEIPALKEDEAVHAANAGDWTTATEPALSAAAADPDIVSYLLMAGLVSDRTGDHGGAESMFLRVARTADLPEAWVNAAAEQLALGNAQAALESVRAGLRLGDQRPAVALPAGEVALELGDTNLARQAFASAIATIPSLAGDRWWTQDPRRAALLPSVIDAAISISLTTDPGAAWEIPLMTGDVSRARALLPEGDQLPQLVVDSWEGDQDAEHALFHLCAVDPLNAASLLWCARVADRLGDAAAGAKYRETAGVIAVSLAKHGAELRVSPGLPRFGQLPGDIADLWATYTYRRPGPWDILVPSLVHLQLE
jgi:Lipid A core - O-antigen ligase and related enzymes